MNMRNLFAAILLALACVLSCTAPSVGVDAGAVGGAPALPSASAPHKLGAPVVVTPSRKVAAGDIAGTQTDGYVAALSGGVPTWSPVTSGSLTLAGDVTGSTGSNTVAQIGGSTGSAGQVLINGPTWSSNPSATSFDSATTHPATTGVFRCANNEPCVSGRNAGNSADYNAVSFLVSNDVAFGDATTSTLLLGSTLSYVGFIGSGGVVHSSAAGLLTSAHGSAGTVLVGGSSDTAFSSTPSAAAFVSSGTNPAASGILRAENNVAIVKYRNAANSADIQALTSDSSNGIALGTNAPTVYLGGNTSTVNVASVSTGVLHANVSGNVSSSTIVDADVNAGAAIACSKTTCTSASVTGSGVWHSTSGSLNGAAVHGSANTVLHGGASDTSFSAIVNADVDAAAAIACSKTTCGGSSPSLLFSPALMSQKQASASWATTGGGSGYTGAIDLFVPGDDVVVTGVRVWCKMTGTFSLKFSVWSPGHSRMVGETDAGIVCTGGNLYTHTFGSPQTLTFTGGASVGYKVTVWETGGAYYPVISTLISGNQGLPTGGPVLLYANGSKTVYAKDFTYATGDTEPLAGTYNIGNGAEFYAVEPVFQ